MDDETVRKHLMTASEYSYIHDDWVTPLQEALDGVSIREALWHPRANSKAIFDIVLHLAVWNENIVERIRTGEPVRPSEGAWPPVPELPSELEWNEAKKRLWDAFAQVREMVESTPIATIEASPYGLGDLLCRFIHNAYHIGQITKLRECVRH